jgi:pyruvate-ferredoxin/flavodoxin oxidoreductase
VDARATADGDKVGVVVGRLYRPFDVAGFVDALPSTVDFIAVLDRTKEPGATGEPLYQDVVAALAEQGRGAEIEVIGGRYGLSSKEFTPPWLLGRVRRTGRPPPTSLHGRDRRRRDPHEPPWDPTSWHEPET